MFFTEKYNFKKLRGGLIFCCFFKLRAKHIFFSGLSVAESIFLNLYFLLLLLEMSLNLFFHFTKDTQYICFCTFICTVTQDQNVSVFVTLNVFAKNCNLPHKTPSGSE